MSVAACPSIIHLTFVRVTRLDAVGNPVAGPNNVVVCDTPIMLTITPDILAGEVKDQKDGGDRLISTYRGQDIRKRYNLELDVGTDQPALEEILTGADIISDTSGDPIGVNFPAPCGSQQPLVAFEAWQDLWDCDHQPAVPYPYLRWVWPGSKWQVAPVTAQNDFEQPKFTGFTVGNPQWGLGIYGDQPAAINPAGGRFRDVGIPTAECGWQSAPIT